MHHENQCHGEETHIWGLYGGDDGHVKTNENGNGRNEETLANEETMAMEQRLVDSALSVWGVKKHFLCHDGEVASDCHRLVVLL